MEHRKQNFGMHIEHDLKKRVEVNSLRIHFGINRRDGKHIQRLLSLKIGKHL